MNLISRSRVLAVAPLVALAVAGCGGNNGSSTTSSRPAATKPPATTKTGTTKTAGKATTLKLRADPSGAFRFDKKSLEAPKGKVTIEMTNPAPIDHNIVVEGNGVSETGAIVKSGGTSTVTADLSPGKYVFFCSVDAHKQAGMQGTLTVR